MNDRYVHVIVVAMASTILLVGFGFLVNSCQQREMACKKETYTVCVANHGTDCAFTTERLCAATSNTR